MEILFYLHASIAVMAIGLAMFTTHAVHALLYMIFSLLCLAVSMYILSAPLAAALEVIVYAGAIMVLFVFAIMLLYLPATRAKERAPFKKSQMVLGLVAFAIFWGELSFVLNSGFLKSDFPLLISTKDIASALFKTYGFLLELISFVLLAGLATAIFVGRSFMAQRSSLGVENHDST